MSRWGWGRRARDARGRSVATPGNYLVDDREVSSGAAVRPRASRPSPHPQRDTDLCRNSLGVFQLAPRVHLAPMNDEGDVAEMPDVGERVGVEDEQVGDGAGGDRPRAVEIEHPRGR